MQQRISVVIPMYRSEKMIRSVVAELHQVLSALTAYSYEILLVNDGSPDKVIDVAMEMAEDDGRIKVIDLAKNSGQPNAMITGYRYATGDYIVNMDDDMQHPAAGILSLLDVLIGQDLDVVFAKYAVPKESAFRRLGSRMNQRMAERLAGKPRNVQSNSFFIMRRFVRDAILAYSGRNPYLYGIMFASTSHIGNAPVEHRPRAVGKSGFTFRKLVSFYLNGFFGFSIKPLRISTLIGCSISAVSLLVGLVIFIQRLLHPGAGVAGWTSLFLVILFFSGIQLICLGILGEYLGRVFLTQSHLPQSCIRATKNIGSPASFHALEGD